MYAKPLLSVSVAYALKLLICQTVCKTSGFMVNS